MPLIPRAGSAGRVRKGFLLEAHVGMQVDLGRLYRFVAEPEGDHATVHSAL